MRRNRRTAEKFFLRYGARVRKRYAKRIRRYQRALAVRSKYVRVERPFENEKAAPVRWNGMESRRARRGR